MVDTTKHSIHYTIDIQYTVYTLYTTLYTIQYIHYTEYSIHTKQNTVCTIQNALYIYIIHYYNSILQTLKHYKLGYVLLHIGVKCIKHKNMYVFK